MVAEGVADIVGCEGAQFGHEMARNSPAIGQVQ
jgi:hypothetical protein